VQFASARHQRSDKLVKQLPLGAIAEEEEEEIKGNVKGDQASVADSNASANKLVRCTRICLYC